MQNKTVLILAAISLSAIVGCSESPQDNAKDVTAAQQQAAQDVAAATSVAQERVNEATQDYNQAANAANADVQAAASEAGEEMHEERLELNFEQAKAVFDLEVVRFNAALKVQNQRCEALTGEAKSACNTAAIAEHDVGIADARVRLEQVENQLKKPN